MLGIIGRRLLQTLPALWVAVTLVWFLVFIVPGNPAHTILGPSASPEQIEELTRRWGLDRPVLERYALYMGRLVRGDLDVSYLRQRPVTEILAERLPRSLLLGGAALALALPAGILLGVATARGRRLAATLLGGLSLAAISVPSFWIGYLLIMLFAVRMDLMPVSGYGSASHLVLPAVTLAIYPAGLIARVTRTAFSEQMRARHVTAARARGLKSRSIVWRHAFRNALAPVVTISGVLTATLIGGAIAIETIFAWPGIGSVLYQAARARDVMLVEGGVILLTALFVAANLLVDLTYALIDPRTRRDAA